MKTTELKSYLDTKVTQYKTLDFIQEDPIQIPLRYDRQQDREIAGLLTATIAWGKRSMIIDNADRMLALMDYAPYDFIKNHQSRDLLIGSGSLHRTFMREDFVYFVQQLSRLYAEQDSLEHFFIPQPDEPNMMAAIERFRHNFMAEDHRASKHVSSPARGSSAKRLNMYLRWMVRDDEIDMGLWRQIPTSKLSIPLDVHSGRIARALGLLERKQDDRKAVEELDSALRELDPIDPVKYDFALFGVGVYEDL